MMETVREFCFVTEVYTQRPTPKAPTKAPAAVTPATDDDLRRAFDELLAAITPAERQTVVAELHRPRRHLVDTPDARAAARAMFYFGL